ncbi:MAG: TetR/AcrR family transcriptional regulator [Acidobacteriia bacterium]|nr:TetR/AcrR family transcriptional regulator [Terriglobia bacterium]
MPATRKSLVPQQARSRESLRKLMKAATEVLGQRGLEGATIPRIAQHAGLSPAAIYRRFPDKDALLETVILHIYERQEEHLRTNLTPEMAAKIPAPVLAAQLVNSIFVSYQMNTGLIRAMRQFLHTTGNKAFCKKAVRSEMRTFEHLINLFMSHRKDIKHADPKVAISLGLMLVVNTLLELIVFNQYQRELQQFLPPDDQQLKKELTTAFLRYLGLEAK